MHLTTDRHEQVNIMGKLRSRTARRISSWLCAGLLLPLNSFAAAIDFDYAVFAANDLGMHCADLDYKIFSILPPFNVVHGQVIRVGDGNRLPELMDDSLIELRYSATSSPLDPAGANSINSTSQNMPGVFKSNFWFRTGQRVSIPGSTEKQTFGGKGYGPLYPSVLAGALLDPSLDLSDACRLQDLGDPSASTGCPSILQLFESIPIDTGLPVPDLELLLDGVLAVDQQHMPGLSNTPQVFGRYVANQPFFAGFGFGQVVPNANWWSAEGIPLMPVDDAGSVNAYPLMKVSAHEKAGGTSLASLDVVLPVASEANCQNCHADVEDAGNGAGSNFASVEFGVIREANAPGPEKLLNAAKLNILKLHDAKHGLKYRLWNKKGKIYDAPCDTGANPNARTCLAKQRKVQCARCHYTPALDLVQGGPVDEPAQAPFGRQQTSHITMSRAMHGHHGSLPDFMGKPLFPKMPPPDDPMRTANQQVLPINDFEQATLEESCYQCHPGTDTKCLRGAMFSSGVVCQDCHGDMAEVGNDFSLRVSQDNPGDFVVDGSLRVPWASEPACQSCHTGDAVNPNHPAGAIVAPDGLRLLRAFAPDLVDVPGVPGPVQVAGTYSSPGSPFAEDSGVNAGGDTVATLYRLSTGHGGVKCEGCHGSTHAIWPVQNPFANDNIAAKQLQGHGGTVTECTTCHGRNSFNIERDFRDNLDSDGRMQGPHGMHPVNDPGWTHDHKEVDKEGRNSCRACHGADGQGTVLSRTADNRILECKESPACIQTSRGKVIEIAKNTQVRCGMCHDNEINH